MPFRFFQSLRSMIGRGYSGNTSLGFTLFAHFVLIRFPIGFHCACIPQVINDNSGTKKRIRFI